MLRSSTVYYAAHSEEFARGGLSSFKQTGCSAFESSIADNYKRCSS